MQNTIECFGKVKIRLFLLIQGMRETSISEIS